jgi:hypothetical protein
LWNDTGMSLGRYYGKATSRPGVLKKRAFGPLMGKAKLCPRRRGYVPEPDNRSRQKGRLGRDAYREPPENMLGRAADRIPHKAALRFPPPPSPITHGVPDIILQAPRGSRGRQSLINWAAGGKRYSPRSHPYTLYTALLVSCALTAGSIHGSMARYLMY